MQYLVIMGILIAVAVILIIITTMKKMTRMTDTMRKLRKRPAI